MDFSIIYRFFKTFSMSGPPFSGGHTSMGSIRKGSVLPHLGVLPYSPSIAFAEPDARFPNFSS
ncbi:hypothetical protein TRIP_B350033 [uncultured Desulfatiglans sp.]|nr:hypothetical protein TRIP_B350033 [uncultured Desulfatiglans sp.]